jgi:hypothetical protein
MRHREIGRNGGNHDENKRHEMNMRDNRRSKKL